MLLTGRVVLVDLDLSLVFVNASSTLPTKKNFKALRAFYFINICFNPILCDWKRVRFKVEETPDP